MNKGVLYAFGAYFLWGFFPIYWKLLKQVAAVQVIAHRIVWSFVLLVAFLTLTAQWQKFRAVAFKPRVVAIYLFSAVLVTLNWLVYVWGVNAGFVVETSLGYFINPLLSVLLGVLFLRERLRRVQWLAVGLAAFGVAYLTFAHGQLPWIALSLAVSFGLYGLVKKMAPLSSLYGLTLETGLVFLPAAAFLAYSDVAGQGAFLHVPWSTNLFLVGAGLVTVVPLLMFAAAARLVPLSVIGIMQYMTPTFQFLLGVFLYKEPFTRERMIGFAFVWVALFVFWGESVYSRQKRKKGADL
ncbi:MAG: EamA family transporter RarD [Chloroflexota bacterium]